MTKKEAIQHVLTELRALSKDEMESLVVIVGTNKGTNHIGIAATSLEILEAVEGLKSQFIKFVASQLTPSSTDLATPSSANSIH